MSQALTRDPNFVLAHVERAQLALARFALGMDQSEANKQSIRSHIDVARQLAPGDANVMATRARYLADVGQDLPGALALFDEAELAGLREAATLDGKGKSFVLTRMGASRCGDCSSQAANRARSGPRCRATAKSASQLDRPKAGGRDRPHWVRFRSDA